LADRLRVLCNEKNTAFYAPLAGALMIQLLYACVAESKQPDADCADPLLHKALLYIEEHLCEAIDLARGAQISREELIEMLNIYYGEVKQ
jgi:hypothetical protein